MVDWPQVLGVPELVTGAEKSFKFLLIFLINKDISLDLRSIHPRSLGDPVFYITRSA